MALGGLFAGESMFTRVRDASKVALVHLVERLRQRGFQLFDVQFLNDHTAGLGAVEIPRSEYLADCGGPWRARRHLSEARGAAAGAGATRTNAASGKTGNSDAARAGLRRDLPCAAVRADGQCGYSTQRNGNRVVGPPT